MQKTYSLRAECLHDIEELEKLLKTARTTSTLSLKPSTHRFPDRVAEIHTSLGFDELLELIRNVEDGHVMLQTLRAVPLSENSLERDFDRE